MGMCPGICSVYTEVTCCPTRYICYLSEVKVGSSSLSIGNWISNNYCSKNDI
jgi:hypothetical protein